MEISRLEIMAKSDLDRNIESLAEISNDQAQSIYDINGIAIDPIWAATFRGFAWGDGSLLMNRYERKRHGPKFSYNVYFRIQLRDDDGEILEHYRSRLGGGLSRGCKNNGNSKPTAQWTVSTIEDAWRIAVLLDDPLGLPFKKREQYPVWRKALDIKVRNSSKTTYPGQYRYTKQEQEYLDWAWDELKRLKQWVDNKKTLVA